MAKIIAFNNDLHRMETYSGQTLSNSERNILRNTAINYKVWSYVEP